jgi:putative ABC transport system ATP-binding protein
MNAVIRLDQVSKIYNGGAVQTALQDVSLTVGGGDFVAIMGASGSGKSTLLNLIAGLDRQSRGTVQICDRDLGGMSEGDLARFRRTHVGVIFQFFHLLNNLNVLDNVLVPAELAGVKRAEARRRARALLGRLHLAEKEGSYPAALSGGQRQRVAIARALINQPPLLLADEPTGALDSRSGDEIMELLEEINRDGQTVVLVTHDARLAARSAGRIITLRDGRIADDTSLAPSPTFDPGTLLSFGIEEARR